MLKKSLFILVSIAFSGIIIGCGSQFLSYSEIASSTSVHTRGVQSDISDYLPIATEADFEKMRNNLDKNFILMNDITLQQEFTPIGNTDAPFTGIFNGNNKSVSGVKIKRQNEDNIGFFSYIGFGGKVHNLKLILANGNATDPSIHGRSQVGALVGKNKGNINYVGAVGGYVKGTRYTGGLVGYVYTAYGGTITNSYRIGTVEGTISVGGLVGYNFNRIMASYVAGTVEGQENVGGIVGFNMGPIANSYAIGKVTGSDKFVGGLVGTNYGNIITSYATTSVSGKQVAGGLVGLISHIQTPIEHSYFDATLTGQAEGIGHSGSRGSNNKKDEVTYPYFTIDQIVHVRNNANAEYIRKIDFVHWDFNKVWRWSGDGQWPTLVWQNDK